MKEKEDEIEKIKQFRRRYNKLSRNTILYLELKKNLQRMIPIHAIT